MRLGDGTTVGVGDFIVTGLNIRARATSQGWVKNGGDWIVIATGADGSLHVDGEGGGAAAVLPGDYVRDHVELGYACTGHPAQRRTVDPAHAYVVANSNRESLSVMATRGQESNRLYEDTSCESDVLTGHGTSLDPLDVLRGAIAASAADTAATEVRRQAHVAADRALVADRQDWAGPSRQLTGGWHRRVVQLQTGASPSRR